MSKKMPVLHSVVWWLLFFVGEGVLRLVDRAGPTGLKKLMREKIIGAALGAAVGDAVGCPFEFQPQAAVRARFPATPELPWIDEMYAPRGIDIHPLGLWQVEPSCGVSTDDTRMSWLLLELAAQLGRAPDRR